MGAENIYKENYIIPHHIMDEKYRKLKREVVLLRIFVIATLFIQTYNLISNWID